MIACGAMKEKETSNSRFIKNTIYEDIFNGSIHIIKSTKTTKLNECRWPEEYILTLKVTGEFAGTYRSVPISRLIMIGMSLDDAMVELL